MKTFLTILITCICITIIGGLAFVIYEKNAELRTYKRQIFGMRDDYRMLQQDYQRYQEKTRNLRQVIITANNSNSKNVTIGAIMNKYAGKIDGDISIYYKNITTGESVVIDGEKQYYMASLYKVILTLYILDEVEKGTIKITDTIGQPPISVQESLNKIIMESNNEYAVFLAEKFDWLTIENAIKAKLGIDFSFNKNLQANVVNIGKLFEDITLALKIPDTESNYLLELLKNQRNTSKLPKYLPNNIYSHNKTGELDDYSHDAGIFYTPKANYILIFMSKTKNTDYTNEQMALLSKDVYDTLNLPAN